MAAQGAISVLIAEDSELTTTVLKSMLSKVPDFSIVGSATSGTEAIESARALRPDVVLMDIGLPGISGIEATQKIKEIRPETRVVVLTVHDNDDTVFAALAAGAHGYCLKTVNAEQLSLAIRTVYDGAAWLDPKIARRVLLASSGTGARRDGTGAAPLVSLTPREIDVLRHVVEGLTNQQIAGKLYLSVETVKSHLRNIMDKLSVSDRTQAAVKAVWERLV